MPIPFQFVYFLGSLVLLPLWFWLYWRRSDLRSEMLTMSLLIGLLSVVTSYVWWTVDWWRPVTLTGTRVGIEDFILGFSFGGIMAVSYEELFKRRLYHRQSHHHYPGGLVIAVLLAVLTSVGIGLGTTSFIASTISLTAAAFLMSYYRHDLIINAVASSLLTVLVSLPFYFFIQLISPSWIDATYQFQSLSGIRITGIPIEELIFWFLAGFVFGPFFEYWKQEQLRRLPVAD